MYQLPFISITVYCLRPIRYGACVSIIIRTPDDDNDENANPGVEKTY
jgi:hypothetical protein